MTKPKNEITNVPAGPYSTSDHQSRRRTILLSKATGKPASIYTIACRRKKSASCARSELQDPSSACADFGMHRPARADLYTTIVYRTKRHFLWDRSR
ncbi:hypothetical protein PITC_007370 [Penicillium italicum]|uniref:Uncharacterized protein n=1 Tax=Penicillium italicum TaxID=40296 RepID=A0A0A2KCT3_PENIT|nr:hypothetical protein PITC_007370 [Penicillium italicum]